MDPSKEQEVSLFNVTGASKDQKYNVDKVMYCEYIQHQHIQFKIWRRKS